MTLSRGTQARIRAGIWLVLLVALIALAAVTLIGCQPVQSVKPYGANNMPGTSVRQAGDSTEITTNKPLHRLFLQTDQKELGLDGENPGAVVSLDRDGVTMFSPKDVEGEDINLTFSTPEGSTIEFSAAQLGSEITPAIYAAQQSLINAQGWVDRIAEAQIARDEAAAAVAVEGVRAALEAASKALVPIP